MFRTFKRRTDSSVVEPEHKMEKKVEIKNKRPTFWETIRVLLRTLKRQDFVQISFVEKLC
jgi:hypothetical protein